MMVSTQTDSQRFEKKITAYIDGTLSPEDRSEFEAFVATHPELEKKLQAKQNEMQFIRGLMPKVTCSVETRVSLENEMKASVHNLFKEPPKNAFDLIKNAVFDWANR